MVRAGVWYAHKDLDSDIAAGKLPESLTDWRDKPVAVGSHVVYGVRSGDTVVMHEAIVTEILISRRTSSEKIRTDQRDERGYVVWDGPFDGSTFHVVLKAEIITGSEHYSPPKPGRKVTLNMPRWVVVE